jgi:CBS domain-containing protein
MSLFENMNIEQVRSLNLRDPVLAKPDDKLRDVIRAMRQHKLGCAILIDGERKPVGMFTESMLTRIVAINPAAIFEPVGDHAADQWPQVQLTDPIVSVLEALELKNVRFLSVVDERGRIAGLTGQKGLMEYVADHFPTQIMVQRVGQSPALQSREGA